MSKSFDNLEFLLGKETIEDLEDYIKKDENNYIDIELDYGVASIYPASQYSDGGRYILGILSENIIHFYVDPQDLFPRNYFIFSNLISELCEFLDFRKVKIIKVSKERFCGSSLKKTDCNQE